MGNEMPAEKKEIYFEEIKSKYPFLNKSVRFHFWPSINIVFADLSDSDKMMVLERKSMLVVNDSALRLLKMCDGTRNTCQIIKEITIQEKIDENVVKDKVINFFHFAANNYRHIHFLGAPSLIKVKYVQTGSKEFYTPIHFALEITNNCNLNCKHCFRLEDSYKPNELSYDEIVDIVDQMYEIGARYIELTGGEFTVHKDFLNIIKYLDDKMDIIGLLSNGYGLNEKIIDTLSGYKNKLLWAISVDSYDPNFHDTFRGRIGAHKKTCDNIKKLKEKGFRVKVSMSMTNETIDHIIPTIDFVYHELKADIFGFSPILPFGRGAQIENLLTLKLSANKFDEIRNYSTKYPGFVAWLDEQPTSKMSNILKNCGAGWKTLTIGPNGDIRPCVLIEEGLLNMGNIKKQSIYDIMNNDIVNYYQNVNLPNEETCGSCFNLFFCKSCFYRGVITNVERIEQGVEICEWGKLNNIETILEIMNKKNSCLNKRCGF